MYGDINCFHSQTIVFTSPQHLPYLTFKHPDPGTFLSPVIVVLAAHTKQFKDSNFNVLKASFLGISTLLEAAHAAGRAKGSRAALSTVVAPAVEKLGDRKLQVTCHFMWIIFCLVQSFFLPFRVFFFRFRVCSSSCAGGVSEVHEIPNHHFRRCVLLS